MSFTGRPFLEIGYQKLNIGQKILNKKHGSCWKLKYLLQMQASIDHFYFCFKQQHLLLEIFGF
jgi:hypothetical protein